MSRTKKYTLIAAAVCIGGVTAFSVSVAVAGSWWRVDSMPYPEEWSALFGASALVALAFAWYQIRQVDQSNRALIASNELARNINIEAVRPRVQVWLQADRIVRRKRGDPVAGSLYITVSNVGVGLAKNVRLTVDPGFTSLPQFFNEGMMEQHFDEINEVFNGEVSFSTLTPGAKYVWFLARVPQIFTDGSAVPRKWVVTAHYEGAGLLGEFQDEFILDLDVEKRIELPVDPLVRIGKDIEAATIELAGIRKAAERS